jgi:hypothetical protein
MTSTGTSLTVKQIAEMERVPARVVLGWIKSGSLPARDMSEKAAERPRWRIDATAWEQFCLSRMNTQPLPKTRRSKHSTDTIELYK